MRQRLSQLAYFGLMAAGAALSFGKVFFLGRYLPKAGFGEYVFLSGIVSYAVPVASLGLLEGLGRRFPMLLGQKRLDEARTLRDACLGAVAAIAAIAVLAIAGGAAIVESASGREVLVRAALVVLEIYAFVFFYFVLRDIRNTLRSALYGVLIFVKGILDVTAVVLVAPRFGWQGVLLAEIVVLTLLTIISFAFFIEDWHFSFSGVGAIAVMVREGMLLTIAGALATTLRLADRVILGAILPREVFAVYGFHLLTITGAGVVLNIVFQYIGPRVLHLYGETGSDRTILQYVRRTSAVLAVLAACGAPLMPLIFSVVSSSFFRGYAVDNTLLLLLYAAGAIDVVNIFTLLLVARGRLRAQIAVNGVTSAIAVTALLLAARTTANLVVFGAVVLAARVIWFLATLFAATAPGDETGIETAVAVEAR